MNLLQGMKEFNLQHHAPHPPGYLVYVWMLRALHSLVGGERVDAVLLLARSFSVATIPLVYYAVTFLRPRDHLAAGVGALLTAISPFFIFYAIDGQTHTRRKLLPAHYCLWPSSGIGERGP